ncbi:Sec61p translocation complex subunit [Orbilia oligospora]|nr:Sec61p translocation complex subunit [Orbilia oligospora]
MSDQVSQIADIPKDFLREGTQFVNRCTKPDRKEFLKISQAVAIGFICMGAIGFVVKLSMLPLNHIHYTTSRIHQFLTVSYLVHIPINNILVGAA